MFVKFKQRKLDVLFVLLIGFFSIVGIAATHNGDTAERDADAAGHGNRSPEVFYPDYSEGAAEAALVLLNKLGQADALQWRQVSRVRGPGTR